MPLFSRHVKQRLVLFALRTRRVLSRARRVELRSRFVVTTSALWIEVGPGGRRATWGNAIGGPVSLDEFEGDSQGLAARACGADGESLACPDGRGCLQFVDHHVSKDSFGDGGSRVSDRASRHCLHG